MPSFDIRNECVYPPRGTTRAQSCGQRLVRVVLFNHASLRFQTANEILWNERMATFDSVTTRFTTGLLPATGDIESETGS